MPKYRTLELLVPENEFSLVDEGLKAKVEHLGGNTAKDVCLNFLNTAKEYATIEESSYLKLIEKRITQGNLANLILRDVVQFAKEKNFHNSVLEVYSKLIKCLQSNRPYS